MNRAISFILVAVATLMEVSTSGAQVAGAKFSHSMQITNPYLPLADLKQDVLEGTEKGKPIRIERTAMPGSKVFKVLGTDVQAMIVEDREFLAGQLSEVTLDYFAQDDEGNVYYMGEDVNNYKNGKVVAHRGAWLYGKQTHRLGLIMPAHPAIGMKFQSEAVGKISTENDEIVSLTETVAIPAGTIASA